MRIPGLLLPPSALGSAGSTAASTEWRAIVTDKEHGILVMDVSADTEAEAKGRARTAAETHLSAKSVVNVIVTQRAGHRVKT